LESYPVQDIKGSGLGCTSLPQLQQRALILVGDGDDPMISLVNAKIMHRLIPRSQLHIYRGGHLELAVDAGRLAATVEAFLNADLTVEESKQ